MIFELPMEEQVYRHWSFNCFWLYSIYC